MTKQSDPAERLLRVLDELRDEVAALRAEMQKFRAALSELSERLNGASGAAGLLGLLGKAIRR